MRSTDTIPQLPLGLLNAAQGHPMLVELKNGETLNGHLVACDTWMNLTLKEVVQTNSEGDRFVKLAEVYVRGNNVSSLFIACVRGWLFDGAGELFGSPDDMQY
jgi:small nuclear ribonucleoprotein (snRNP)-like protein